VKKHHHGGEQHRHHHAGGHSGGGGGAGRGMENAGDPRAQAPRQPFIKNTRQRRQSAGAQIAIPAGGNASWTSQPFAQVGLVNRFFLHVRVLLNSGATLFGAVAQPAYKGPFNFIKNISLDLNLGSTNLVKTTGFGLAMNLVSKKRGFNPYSSSGPASAGTGRDPFFNVGYNGATVIAANKAFAIEFMLVVPVAGNDDDNFTLGLVNLQSPEVQMTLSGNYGVVTDLLANASGTTTITGGYMQPYIEYYEIPPPSRRVAMPPLVVHRLAEDQQPLTSSGTPFIYQIPRQGKLLRLISYYDNVGSLVLQGSPIVAAGTNQSPTSSGILNWQVLANITDSVYSEDYALRRFLMQELFGDYPTAGSSPTTYGGTALNGAAQYPQLLGGFLHEFWGATGEPACGNFRDVFDAEALTTLQFITNFDPGLAVTAGAYGGFIREFWQPLAAGVARGLIGR
jgi:hypothetical protein